MKKASYGARFLLALILGVGMSFPSYSQNDPSDIIDELENVIERVESTSDDDPTKWFDLSLQRHQEKASFSFALKYQDKPTPPPDHIKILWITGSVDVPLTPGAENVFTAGVVQLRLATQLAPAGTLDRTHPTTPIVYLPAGTNAINIELDDRQWEFSFLLPGDSDHDQLPVIENVVVMETAYLKKFGSMSSSQTAYPFHEDAPFGAQDSRSLFVYGKNLPTSSNDTIKLLSGNDLVAYQVMSLPEDDQIPGFGPGWELAGVEETEERTGLYLKATFNEGIVPGPNGFRLNGAGGLWLLDFSDAKGVLYFAHEVKDREFEPTDSFFGSDVGHIVIAEFAPIPHDSIEVEILHNGEPIIGTNEGKLTAERFDDSEGAEYRTPPLRFYRTDNRYQRPPDNNSSALSIGVRPGDIISARLANPFQMRTAPLESNAEILATPSDLGETWKGALARVTACYPSDRGVDFADMQSSTADTYSKTILTKVITNRMRAKVSIDEMIGGLGYIFLKDLINGDLEEGIDITKGDQAAAILIRDEFVKQMRATYQLDDKSILADPMKIEAFFDASQTTIEPIYSNLMVTNVRGESVPLKDLPLTTSANGFEIDPAQLRRFWLTATKEALQDFYEHMVAATERANNAGDCDLKELMVVAGHDMPHVTTALFPRLFKLEDDGAHQFWVPDNSARGYVKGLRITGGAIRALDDYGKIDDAYKAMALALVTGGAAFVMSGSGFVAGAGYLMLTADGLDAAYFGTKGILDYIEAEDFRDYAYGALPLTGDALMAEAELARSEWYWAAVGVIAPGLGSLSGARAIKGLRNAESVARGSKLIEGASSLDKLKRAGLSAPQQRDLAAVFSDLQVKRAESGMDALSQADQASLRKFDEFFANKLPSSDVSLPPSHAPPGVRSDELSELLPGSARVDPTPSAPLVRPDPNDTLQPGHPDYIAYLHHDALKNNYFLGNASTSKIRDPEFHLSPTYSDDITILDATNGIFAVNGQTLHRGDILNPVAANPGGAQNGNFADVYNLIDENGELAPIVQKTFGEREGWMKVDDIGKYGRQSDYKRLKFDEGRFGNEEVKYASLDRTDGNHLEMMDDIEYGAGILEKANIPQLPIKHVDYSGPSPILFQRRLNADLPDGVVREASVDDELLRMVKTEGPSTYSTDDLKKAKYYAKKSDEFAPHRNAYLRLRRKMADAGIVWEDGHFGNIFFQEMSDGTIRAAILDTDRMGYAADNLASGLKARKGRQPAHWMNLMHNNWQRRTGMAIDRSDPIQMTLAALLHKGMFRVDPVTRKPMDGLLRIEEIRRTFPEFNQFFPP